MAFHRTMLAVRDVGAGVGQHHGRCRGNYPGSPRRGRQFHSLVSLMAAGFEANWMMNLATNKLIRINPGDNLATEIPITGVVGPFANAGLAVGEGAVWLPDYGRSIIYKIDPGTSRVVMEIPADSPRRRRNAGKIVWIQLTVGEGSVWAIISNNELRRYSATDGTTEAAVSLPSRSSGVIVAFGSVWVTGTENDELYRIDPKTNQIAGYNRTSFRSAFPGRGRGICLGSTMKATAPFNELTVRAAALLPLSNTGAIGKGSIAIGGGFVWVSHTQ